MAYFLSNPQIYSMLILAALLAVLWYFYRQNNQAISAGGASLLSRYSRDLTRLAVEKKLDPVIGREEEIGRVIQILSRRNKNNPVLIGNAGVGKTAIAEGLALRIVSRQVPPALNQKRVLALDLPGLLAGTKYRGEFEQRLKKVTDEIVKAKRLIILFIDEIHVLAEAGEAEGAINAADILKPLLARGDLQVVGATTKEEYLQFIKQDKTLDRRLQPVFVSEPTGQQTEQILTGIKNVYEHYHNVVITPEAIKAAVLLTAGIKERSYPDKAIDAIDEAGSRVRLKAVTVTDQAAVLKVTAADIEQVVKEWLNNE